MKQHAFRGSKVTARVSIYIHTEDLVLEPARPDRNAFQTEISQELLEELRIYDTELFIFSVSIQSVRLPFFFNILDPIYVYGLSGILDTE